jgi:hypothetical protein
LTDQVPKVATVPVTATLSSSGVASNEKRSMEPLAKLQ